jgi:hypothetical protein
VPPQRRRDRPRTTELRGPRTGRTQRCQLVWVARKAANRWAFAQPCVGQRKSHCPAASVRGDPVHRTAFNSSARRRLLLPIARNGTRVHIGLHGFQAIQSRVCPCIRPLHSSRGEKCSRWAIGWPVGATLGGSTLAISPSVSPPLLLIIPLFCGPFQSVTRGGSLYSGKPSSEFGRLR